MVKGNDKKSLLAGLLVMLIEHLCYVLVVFGNMTTQGWGLHGKKVSIGPIIGHRKEIHFDVLSLGLVCYMVMIVVKYSSYHDYKIKRQLLVHILKSMMENSP